MKTTIDGFHPVGPTVADVPECQRCNWRNGREFTKRSPRPYDHTGDTCLIAYSSDCDGSNRYANAGKNHQATKISDPLRCQFSYENNKNPFFRSIDR